MKRLNIIGVLAVSLLHVPAFAQEAPKPEEPTSQPAKADEKSDEKSDKKSDDKKKDEKKDADKKDGDADANNDGDAKPKIEKAVENAEQEAEKVATDEKIAETEEVIADADADSPFGDSPIAELADKDFVPLESIEEEELEQIVPAKVHPRIDWSGSFRVRTGLRNNFDLDTGGTSAVLPPIEANTPLGTPANPGKEARWSTNFNLRLDPTIHILRDVRIHTEVELLPNIGFGSTPEVGLGIDPLKPQIFGQPGSSGQFSPRERELFGDALAVNELYGEFDTLFATISAGRMDDEWGLGMYTSSGDCEDCDYGNHVDRFKLRTGLFNLYGDITWDFPDEGPTSGSAIQTGGQPYDLTQIDDADQWTFSIFRKALTREERELEAKKQIDQDAWIPNGGLQYRYQKQKGTFAPRFDPNGNAFDLEQPPTLLYLGSSAHVFDAWTTFEFRPDYKRYIRIGLEGLIAFGSIDNASGAPVGVATDDEEEINCFDDDVRASEPTRCSEDENGNSTKRDLLQFGLALESEFRFDSPVSFGFNAGFASGGDSPNWGTSGNGDLDFFRFNPDYHVDLILFREVIGTVTNAFYGNPYANIRFFESANRHIEVQVDGILSHAFNTEGTPSGESGWLGLEMDAGIKYVLRDAFTASLQGGLLFPFDGLSAITGRPRYVNFGSNVGDFVNDADASIPWTIQGKFFWNF